MVPEQSHSEPDKLPEVRDGIENEVEQPAAQETKKPVEEKLENPPAIQGQLGPNLAIVPASFQPPITVMQPPMLPLQFPARVPTPFFGHQFKPMIRSQASSFVSLPPNDQPIFDSLCQHQGQCPKCAKSPQASPFPVEF